MTTVQNLLSRKPIAEIFSVEPGAALAAAAALMVENRIGALVVRAPGNPMSGIVTERDIVRAVAERPADIASLTVSDLSTASVETCACDDGLRDVVRRMGAGRFRHMPVVENGELTGLISVTDIFRYYMDHEPQARLDVMAAYYRS